MSSTFHALIGHVRVRGVRIANGTDGQSCAMSRGRQVHRGGALRTPPRAYGDGRCSGKPKSRADLTLVVRLRPPRGGIDLTNCAKMVCKMNDAADHTI